MKVVSDDTAKWFQPLAAKVSGFVETGGWELICGHCSSVLMTAPDWRLPGTVIRCPSCGRQNVSSQNE